jgi:hypothetical protein
MGELVHEILQKSTQCHSSFLPTDTQEKRRMNNWAPKFRSDLFEGLLVNYSVQYLGQHDNTAKRLTDQYCPRKEI